MKINNKIKEIIMITIILIIQTIIFIIAGINKSYIHMDEAYSLGLTNYNKVEIQQNDDFYDTWHNKKYFEDYLSVNEDEKKDFSPVYENQKNDVHPPLYYLLLRIAMQFNIDNFSKWPGIILNIIIYIFITFFVYLIIKKLLFGTKKYKEKSVILALLSSLTLSSINNVIYIRMYALSNLNILITTYLHLKLIDKEKNSIKLFIAIGLSALIGSLTHYYYLFYLIFLFIMILIKYLREKNYKELVKYITTMIIAGILSLIIFPYSINHIFFGYRGQGAISNLFNISEFLKKILQYLLIINVYTFNNILLILILFILGIIIYKKYKKIKLIEVKNKYLKYILYPTIFYFILVSLSAPWIELRYMMPICNLIFIIIYYLIIMLLNNLFNEKIANIIITISFIILFIMPFISNQLIDIIIGKEFRNETEATYSTKQEIVKKLKNESNIPIDIFYNFSNASIDNILLFVKNFKIEPEVMYSNKLNLMKMIKNDFENIPALYLFNSNNNRFLDDILLFANISESYIAKDIECNDENIKKIMENQNLSNGILVFINDGQNGELLLEIVKESLGLNKSTYLQRLNACDLYYITASV